MGCARAGGLMRVLAVRTVLPEHHYDQRRITEAVAGTVKADQRLVERFHAATRVSGRNLALAIEDYAGLTDFTAANDAYIATALELAERAVGKALDAGGLAPEQVDHLVFCSSTGVATPSLDAALAQRAGLREDVKRLPVFGLGCAAGAAGLSRLHDYLRAWPEQVAVLVCVELCSLTVQRDDASVANLVGSGLFGDGAAAVVAAGDRRDIGGPPPDGPGWGPRVVATRSRLYPDTARLMGWNVGEHGFRIVLAADLVDHVEASLAGDVTAFLRDHGLTPGEIASWVCHPGGPKVIETIGAAFGLDGGELDLTWDSLRKAGNLSSVSVLNVLEETIARRPRPPDAPGLLMALGPGFSAEMVLLRW
ncbi:type III polyketide synthase [Actinomadura opuntiae]|uniref:type III polyketide synthase n=1 Tax=Actinomadura sp. OS1-43 TaxID=604315 RepID=UPI00255A9AC2|nr:3-oxoacyl-[acyl-carrier-protein] synthase III C-terminal domain-containing protein [Actinomadura sp. OS1-43]MDL4815536.1 3-oxoacyl-[acyl-carrier-protein] synthase III C-terminal domain-containing protein [Actinomadura sp. OS1-43]